MADLDRNEKEMVKEITESIFNMIYDHLHDQYLVDFDLSEDDVIAIAGDAAKAAEKTTTEIFEED